MSKTKTARPDHDGPERGIFAHNKALLRKTATLCALCGLPLDKSLRYPDPMSISIDHIIPIALGGRSTLDNLQATHLVCNKQKGTRMLTRSVDLDENKKQNFSNADEFNRDVKKSFEQIPQYIDWKSYEG